MQKRLGSQRGFTLVELVLYIVLSGIVFQLAAQIMMTQLDTYSFISNRKAKLSDIRYAMNRISYELLRVSLDDITVLDADRIEFTDMSGNATSYYMSGGDLYKGPEKFLEGVSSFVITPYDANGMETAILADMRKLQVSIETAAVDNEGSITLAATITPRSFLYAGYE